MDTAQGLSECRIRPELIPDSVRHDIGRAGLEAVRRYFEDPAHEQAFREWLKAQDDKAPA